MGKLICQCPSCGSSEVKVAKIECEKCLTKFEGSFEIPSLLRLSDDDLEFAIDFIKCSGSLKEMAEQHGVSYPTMRNRLNALIETIEALGKSGASERDTVLALLESGKISAADAAKRLRKL